jgi:hypothetical protein
MCVAAVVTMMRAPTSRRPSMAVLPSVAAVGDNVVAPDRLAGAACEFDLTLSVNTVTGCRRPLVFPPKPNVD